MSQADVLPAPELERFPEGTGKWEQERGAYWRLRPTLVSQYRDQYVAIHEGQVVDSGPDQVELALRVYRRFGYVPIYVGLVSDEPPRMLRVPTPRVVEKVRDA
jgi:hypothetical protein